ncbi:MAG: TrfB-related DNA-binding protein [Azoarcus sp.]|jgi:ribosomal protein L15E|nr:TrfB-related DNA-binding protein [Azoarcus sp.]
MSELPRLTADQFDALAELLRLRESSSREAARLVLVEGMSRADAQRATGMTGLQGVSNVLTRCRRGIELARRVVA